MAQRFCTQRQAFPAVVPPCVYLPTTASLFHTQRQQLRLNDYVSFSYTQWQHAKQCIFIVTAGPQSTPHPLALFLQPLTTGSHADCITHQVVSSSHSKHTEEHFSTGHPRPVLATQHAFQHAPKATTCRYKSHDNVHCNGSSLPNHLHDAVLSWYTSILALCICWIVNWKQWNMAVLRKIAKQQSEEAHRSHTLHRCR